jgi:DNA-binding beta-propeller fold protein YncE
MALPAADGRTVFVSVDSDTPGNNGIEVMRRDGRSLQFFNFIPLDGVPLGLSLAPDGSTLFIADNDGIAALSAPAAEQGLPTPVHYLRARGAQTIEVQSSANGAYVFFTNEAGASVGVARFNARDAQPWQFVGAIQTDLAPVGMALSPDGKWLYVTSEIKPSLVRPCSVGMQQRAEGTLRVIDAIKAATDPASASIAVATAGCSPVRVALSPDGTMAFVTARGDNSVVVFDTSTLRTNPSRATRRAFAAGAAPVGIAMVRGGQRAVVADSNRFAGSKGALSVLDFSRAKNPLIAIYPSGLFPREITESPQHDVMYLTDYVSQTIEIIPESAIP